MPDAEEERIVGLLRRLGATDEELARSPAERSYGDLALELVLRTAPPASLPDAAAATGLAEDELRYLWQLLGLPALRAGSERIPADLLAALPVVAAASDGWMGLDLALALARVVGSTTARLAEALVDTYRVQFEVPKLASGVSYPEIVERQVALSQASIEGFERFVTAVFRAHLVRVASAAWTPDEGRTSTRRDLFVGFVDLVGYTALARTLSMAELADLLRRFEDTVGDVVAAGGGRLVKLIGDSAMFVADSAAEGCSIALDVAERFAGSAGLPPGRLGADCGSVLSLHGDYFGDVVNLAARLVAVAEPGAVVVSEAVAAAVPDRFGFEPMPPAALKGLQVPAVSYRLRRPPG